MIPEEHHSGSLYKGYIVILTNAREISTNLPVSIPLVTLMVKPLYREVLSNLNEIVGYRRKS